MGRQGVGDLGGCLHGVGEAGDGSAVSDELWARVSCRPRLNPPYADVKENALSKGYDGLMIRSRRSPWARIAPLATIWGYK